MLGQDIGDSQYNTEVVLQGAQTLTVDVNTQMRVERYALWWCIPR